MREISTVYDADNLQTDLSILYNNMEFNRLKFLALKYGRNDDLKNEYDNVNSEFSDSIECKKYQRSRNHHLMRWSM